MKATGIHEYSRECKVEGALLARIAFLIVLYAVAVFVTLFFSILLMSIPAFIIMSVLSLSIFLVTRPLLSEQRDYEIVDGSFRIYRIYGRASSKKVFECELRDMLSIAPYDDNTELSDLQGVKNFLSDSRAKGAYYAVYDNKGARCAVIFDGDEKFACAAAFYCRSFRRW